MMTLGETYYVVRAMRVKWLRKVTDNRDMLPSSNAFTNYGHCGVGELADTFIKCKDNEISVNKHEVFNANFMYLMFLKSLKKTSDQIAVFLWDDAMDICCLYRGRYKYFYRAYLPTKKKLRVFAVIRDEDVTKIFVTDIEHSKRLIAFLKED